MSHDPTNRVERAFTAHLWAEFSKGRSVRCVRESEGTIAVAITQSQAYQLRCSTCHWHSEWFFVEGDRLRSLHAAPTRRHL